jgi:hypothetical protein
MHKDSVNRWVATAVMHLAQVTGIVSSRSAMVIAAGGGGASRGDGRLLATVAVMSLLLGADTAHHLGDEMVIGGVVPPVSVG